MPALTNAARNALLDLAFVNGSYTPPATVYLAMMTSPPGADGTGVEVTGGGYAREAVTFSAAAAGIIASSAGVSFAPLSSAADVLLSGWAIYDASTAGNMLVYHVFSTPRLIHVSTNLDFATGAIVVESDGAGMTDYLANKLLDHMLRNTAYTPAATVYLAAFLTAPTRSTAGTEVSSGGYAREAVTFAQLVDGVFEMTSVPTTFAPLHTGAAKAVVALGVADASTSGNLLAFGSFADTQTVPANDDFEVGDVRVALS